METDILMLIERLGVGATAFILMYILFRKTQEKTFNQADRILAFAETTIKENTIALEKMFMCLQEHMSQKDRFIEEMRECKRVREEHLSDIQRSLNIPSYKK